VDILEAERKEVKYAKEEREVVIGLAVIRNGGSSSWKAAPKNQNQTEEVNNASRREKTWSSKNGRRKESSA